MLIPGLPTPARCSSLREPGSLRSCAPCPPPKSLAKLAQGGAPLAPPLHARSPQSPTRSTPLPTSDTTVTPASPPRRAILCAACKHPITRTDAAIAVAGSHEHTFMNPGGLVFQIACYREAPGALQAGPPSPEWTWFPGHLWRVTLCAACLTHLGWSFHRESSTFFGLVLDRIVEEEPP